MNNMATNIRFFSSNNSKALELARKAELADASHFSVRVDNLLKKKPVNHMGLFAVRTAPTQQPLAPASDAKPLFPI